MVYIKLFQTEQEKQACTDTYEYLSYTIESDKVNIHEEVFFCKLTLNNGEIVEIEGNGELTSAMTSGYLATTISVEIGELCTSIGSGAFNRFRGLTSITIPNSVTSINGAAFQNCTALSSITIGNSVTSINNGAFVGCTSLSSITIPNSVTSIGGLVFGNCTALSSITIGNSVSSIGVFVLTGCTALSSITSLATTAPTIEDTTFYGIKNNNGTLYVPSGSIGYDSWMDKLQTYNWTKVEQ